MTTELRIQTVSDDKRRFMDLLLIGDEQESMIDRYLDRGTLYVGTMAGVAVCVCVVTRESSDTVEIKNIAVHPEYRRRCIGHRMLGSKWSTKDITSSSEPAKRHRLSGSTERQAMNTLIVSKVSSPQITTTL